MKILQRPSFIVSDPLTVQHCGECNRDFAEAPGAPMLPMAHCEEELDGKNTATDCWGSCCRSCRRCSGSTNSVRRSRLHKVRGRRWKPRCRRPGNLACDASRVFLGSDGRRDGRCGCCWSWVRHLSTEVREKVWFIDSHSLPPKKDFTEKQARLPPLPKSTMIAHCSKRGKQSRSLSVQKTQTDLSYKMIETAIYNDNKLKDQEGYPVKARSKQTLIPWTSSFAENDFLY